MNRLLSVLVWSLYLSLPVAAQAAPVVLGKEPGVTPTVEYEAFMRQRMASDHPTVSTATVSQPAKAPSAPPMAFPIVSKTLTPGIVQRRALPHGPKQPICLVGSDRRSLAWIRRNRDTLQRVGAVCLIVEAKDRLSAAKVKKALAGIPAYPASADDITPTLGLHHYPALLSRAGVEQ